MRFQSGEPLKTFLSAVAVTTSDSTVIDPTRGLYIGGAGGVKVDMASGETGVTFAAVPVGTTLNISVTKVYATGTAATNILALY